MRKWFAALSFLLVSAPAWCQDIVAVLERSQSVRLAAMSTVPTEDPRAAVVRTSFDQLAQRFASEKEIEVRVIKGPVIAECLEGAGYEVVFQATECFV